MSKLVALIIGITGQDGSYLAYLLIKKGYKVYGTSRDALTANTSNLRLLGIEEEVDLLTTSTNDFRSIIFTLEKTNPDLIFHLGGQTSVGLSFQLPFEAVESISTSTLNLLESVRFFNKKIRIFVPCSSDCFGNLSKIRPANEKTPLNPMSPYAVAKSSAFWLAKTYRESYGMFISIGFLSNHESPIRGKHFVTSKIFNIIKKIKKKQISDVYFGDLRIIRDWGWAPSYVEAIYKILMYEKPDDFIIATGKSYSLEQIIEKAFLLSGLGDYRNYIKSKNLDKRPNEIKTSYLDPSKANEKLKWSSHIGMDEMIKKLLNGELL